MNILDILFKYLRSPLESLEGLSGDDKKVISVDEMRLPAERPRLPLGPRLPNGNKVICRLNLIPITQYSMSQVTA